MAIDSGVYQDRQATDRQESYRADGAAHLQGRLAGILRREDGVLHWEAGKEVPDLEHRRLPGGQVDDREPSESRHDIS